MSADKIQVSIIVPTRNRCNSLRQTLSSLCNQNFPKEHYEIIIVDNNSDDDTFKTVEEFVKNHKELSIVYVKELNKGVHFARNRGAGEAKAAILAFVDDDVICDAHWLAELLKPYQVPSVGCVGGKVLVKFEHDPPQWVKKLPILTYVHFDLGSKLKDVLDVYALNFSIRKELLYRFGGFNPDYCGDDWIGDGEGGLLEKIREYPEYRILYAPKAIVWHCISKNRLTLQWVKHRFANVGAAYSYWSYRKKRYGVIILIVRSLIFIALSAFFKIVALISRIVSNNYYYILEIKASFYKSRYQYTLRLVYDNEFKSLVLKQNWLEKK